MKMDLHGLLLIAKAQAKQSAKAAASDMRTRGMLEKLKIEVEEFESVFASELEKHIQQVIDKPGSKFSDMGEATKRSLNITILMLSKVS